MLGHLNGEMCDAYGRVPGVQVDEKIRRNTLLELTQTKQNTLRKNPVYAPSLELKSTMVDYRRERIKINNLQINSS